LAEAEHTHTGPPLSQNVIASTNLPSKAAQQPTQSPNRFNLGNL